MTQDAYRELLRRGGIADLAGRTILRFTGADRTRYLNGQVTANIQTLALDHAIPTCVTTAKGKLSADGFVTNSGDALWFDADPGLRETLPARFERYIIADDVTLEDMSDAMRVIHLLPGEEGFESMHRTGFGSLRAIPNTRFGRRGFDFLLTEDEAKKEAQEWASFHVTLSVEDVENLRIEQGIPRWGAELDENTLPPEAGLDRTHIDYYKGCYIGQEVISRIKSIGHVNRRLAGFVSTSGAPLSPSMQIVSAAAPTGDPCGSLTSAGWSFALEKPIALGYLRRSAPPGDFVARTSTPGVEPVPITACELPFTK
jgi:tRNA-modifying protein YgfZ